MLNFRQILFEFLKSNVGLLKSQNSLFEGCILFTITKCPSLYLEQKL